MVSPYPDLDRRIRNTDGIVDANKSQFVPNLSKKYPRDYIDLDTHKTLIQIKPWIEESSSLPKSLVNLRSSSSSQILQTDRILILCVDFADKPSQIPISTIYDRFFSDIGNSFKNYYKEVSYDQYIPYGEIHGWYRAPLNSAFYANNNYGLGNYPQNAQRLVEDVIEMARNDTSIDWASFDINNDGYLNNIIIIHSGAEAAVTGNVNDIWAHVWGTFYIKNVQGKMIRIYAITSEYISSPSEIQRSGVDCHEFGHLLGLPDLYDNTEQSNGVGIYSVMGYGGWANDGLTPTHLDAWSKYILGFSTAINNPQRTVTLYDAETSNNNVIYLTPNSREYFIIENRQKKLFDSYLPSDGILIWHINENQPGNNNKLCYIVGLVQADNLKDLENRANNGDDGDSYPGSSNNRSFGRYTNPNSVLCDGNKYNVLIDNISDSADIMTFNSSFPIITGSLRFITIPTGADIYLDTILKGTTNIDTGMLIINDIPIDRYIYTIKKTGYYDYIGSVNIVEGMVTDIIVTLAHLVQSTVIGTLNITSSPTGAKIYVDDIDTGYTTPAIIQNILEGSHKYKLTLSGYQDKTDTFDIIAGQTTIIDTGNLEMIVVQAGVSSPLGILLMIGLIVGHMYSSTHIK